MQKRHKIVRTANFGQWFIVEVKLKKEIKVLPRQPPPTPLPKTHTQDVFFAHAAAAASSIWHAFTEYTGAISNLLSSPCGT